MLEGSTLRTIQHHASLPKLAICERFRPEIARAQGVWKQGTVLRFEASTRHSPS